MRAVEIVGLTWDRGDLQARVAHLTRTKNGTARDVPSSSEAVRILESLPHMQAVSACGQTSLTLCGEKSVARPRSRICISMTVGMKQ